MTPQPGTVDLRRSDAAAHARAELPEPTSWPMALAAGLTLMCFGIITSGIFFLAGLALICLAIAGWMRLLRKAAPGRTPAVGRTPSGSETE